MVDIFYVKNHNSKFFFLKIYCKFKQNQYWKVILKCKLENNLVQFFSQAFLIL